MGDDIDQDLDGAWDSVPSSPAIVALDPIEHLTRIFRGAIAANPTLWRSVDLEAATAKLASLARERKSKTVPILLEDVRTALIKMHASRSRVRESFLAFAQEAEAAGFAVILPKDIRDLPDRRKDSLVRAFYARLAAGGQGAAARQGALSGERTVFSLPPRSEVVAKALGALVVVGTVLLVIDGSGPPDQRALFLTMPSEATACQKTEAVGHVLRCTVSDPGSGVSAETARAQQQSLRRAAIDAGFVDVLIVDATGRPVTVSP